MQKSDPNQMWLEAPDSESWNKNKLETNLFFKPSKTQRGVEVPKGLGL